MEATERDSDGEYTERCEAICVSVCASFAEAIAISAYSRFSDAIAASRCCSSFSRSAHSR